MSDLFEKLKRYRVWSIGVYVERADFSFKTKLGTAKYVLNAKKMRKRGRHVHTYADPFLFEFNDELFMFYESQAVAENGKIEAVKTSDLEQFTSLGEILTAPFHLSYPFVFVCNSFVFLMPESSGAGEVGLYKFESFPDKAVKSRVLLKGRYQDSSAVHHNGVWYLFTTSDRGLEIFFTENLEKDALIPHPLNPITTDSKYYRCGGSPLILDGKMYRIAQDGSGEYGKNIHILQVNELSATAYDEEVIAPDYFDLRESWNSQGGHHLSIVKFKGRSVVAVDGKQNDLLINRLLALLYKF